MKRRGQAVLGVLLVSTVLLTVLLVASGAWVFQSGLHRRLTGSEGARRLAESAASVAVARLLKEPEANPSPVDLELTAYPDGHGRLTFTPDPELPLSVNNLRGTGSLPGWGDTVVAAESASLVATGRYQGVEERVEVVLHVPRFPYVVASSVDLEARDGLTVFGVASPAALAGGVRGIPAEQRVPGHLVTNQALELSGATTHVEGDVQARGTIAIEGGAEVTGEVRPHSDAVPLPKTTVTSFDPASKPGCTALTSSDLGPTELSGFQRRAGDLNVAGGLTLKGGVLYVEGKLHVTGGVQGKGAILATGGVDIEGGGSLEGDAQLAIVAGGPVSLQGTAAESAEFHGLLYTEGNLDCRYADIAGAVVVNNPDPEGHASLEHVTLAESPELAAFQFKVLSSYGPAPSAGGPQPSPPPNYGALPIASADGALGNPSSAFGNSLFGVILSPDRNALKAGSSFAWDSSRPLLEAATAQISWTPSATSQYLFDSTVCSAADLEATLTDILVNQRGMDADQARAAASAAANEARSGLTPALVESWVTALNAMEAYDAAEGTNLVGTPQVTAQTETGQTVTYSVTDWKLDLSEFFQLADRIRILSWRRL